MFETDRAFYVEASKCQMVVASTFTDLGIRRKYSDVCSFVIISFLVVHKNWQRTNGKGKQKVCLELETEGISALVHEQVSQW